jgi:hypothetical protein
MTSLTPEQTLQQSAKQAIAELLLFASVTLDPELGGQEIDPESINAALTRFIPNLGDVLSLETLALLSSVFANHASLKLITQNAKP